MNNKQIAEQVFATHFQMELSSIVDQDMQMAVTEKVVKYKAEDTEGRAMMYVMEATNFEHFKRQTVSFITGEYVAMSPSLPIWWHKS